MTRATLFSLSYVLFFKQTQDLFSMKRHKRKSSHIKPRSNVIKGNDTKFTLSNCTANSFSQGNKICVKYEAGCFKHMVRIYVVTETVF